MNWDTAAELAGNLWAWVAIVGNGLHQVGLQGHAWLLRGAAWALDNPDGALATATSLAGAYLLALGGTRAAWGWLGFLVANIAWICFAWRTDVPGLLVCQVGFLATSWMGLSRSVETAALQTVEEIKAAQSMPWIDPIRETAALWTAEGIKGFTPRPPQPAPYPAIRHEDTAMLDYLSEMVVEVRHQLRYGSRRAFLYVPPIDLEGDPTGGPTLREKILDAVHRGHLQAYAGKSGDESH